MSLLAYLALGVLSPSSSDCPRTCGPPPAACFLRAVGSPRTFATYERPERRPQ